MNQSTLKTVCIAVTLALAAPAWAGLWTNSSGTSDNLSYANGGDLLGHFGDPYIAADTFYFVDTNFHVFASNGGTTAVSDAVSVDVVANPGLQFSSVTVSATGSYSTIGSGSSVDIDASLSMLENGGLGRSWTGQLNTTPGFPIGGDAQGIWDGAATVDVTWEFPIPHNDIHVSLSNVLQAIAGAAGSAEMNVQFEQLTISFEIVPEPATIALLGLGVFALLRRK